MNASAKSFVGAADNEQGFLAFLLHSLGLCLFKHRVRGLAIVPGFRHGFLGACQLCRGNNLHRFGNLLNVPDGLEAIFDFP